MTWKIENGTEETRSLTRRPRARNPNECCKTGTLSLSEHEHTVPARTITLKAENGTESAHRTRRRSMAARTGATRVICHSEGSEGQLRLEPTRWGDTSTHAAAVVPSSWQQLASPKPCCFRTPPRKSTQHGKGLRHCRRQKSQRCQTRTLSPGGQEHCSRTTDHAENRKRHGRNAH